MNAIICCLTLFGLTQLLAAQGRVAVEPAVAVSAQAAVQKLGQEMMKGNFEYGQQRMYPRWKRRLAKRYGGMEKLEAALAGAAQQKIKMRLAVVAFQADRPTSFFSVWRTKKFNPLTNKPVKDAAGNFVIVEHWLAFVPTTTRVKIPDSNQGGKMVTAEEKSYTTVISEKGSNDWYFMTGLKPSIQDLRGLFPTLPPKKEELGLPPSSAREIK
ncbi:MAG: hypothetical protein AB8F34_08280 [Akkermansiaceae bacterium]